jgi:hypothetical protein
MGATTSANGGNEIGDMRRHLAAIKSLLAVRLAAIDWANPTTNRVVPSLPPKTRRQLLAELKIDALPAVAAFYTNCDGISLPDLAGGRFIHGLKMIRKGTKYGQPQRIAEPNMRRVLVFGSDGGGGLFAFDLDAVGPPVLHLPPGRVLDGMYTPDAEVRRVADSFTAFLDCLYDEIGGGMSCIGTKRESG